MKSPYNQYKINFEYDKITEKHSKEFNEKNSLYLANRQDILAIINRMIKANEGVEILTKLKLRINKKDKQILELNIRKKIE